MTSGLIWTIARFGLSFIFCKKYNIIPLQKINCLFKTDGSMGYNGGFNYEEDIDDVIVSVCCDIFSM